IHQAIGKVSTEADKLIANFKAIMEAINKHKPESMKGTYIKKITLTTTMGPGIKVSL
ncbi:MAG: 50S ribosomal protein L1, partial [Parcubacteria group bacterium]